MSRPLIRGLVTLAGLVLLWEVIRRLTGAPSFYLPSPLSVAEAIWRHRVSLADNALVTAGEVIAGFVIGATLGAANALSLISSPFARRWLEPLLIFSQAAPVYALAPLLTLWLGFGIGSKIVMTALVIFFPVTAAFYDGLRRTDPGLLDLARVMGASPRATLWRLRVPAATPALASGLKLAAVYAPIGAVIGEWVGGGSRGLGYLMIYANARTKADLLFAALIILALFAILFHRLVGLAVSRLTRWAPETTQ